MIIDINIAKNHITFFLSESSQRYFCPFHNKNFIFYEQTPIFCSSTIVVTDIKSDFFQEFG